VLDGGVVVFDAVGGVEAQSETVWRQADRYRVPRICFINKMDRVGSNLPRTVEMITERLKAVPLLIQIPIGSEAAFTGMVDLVEEKAWVFDGKADSTPQVGPVPEELREQAHKARHALIEKLAEYDDQIMVAYLEGHEVIATELKAALRRVALANKAVPVLCGTALRNRGVQPLLDAVVDYLPSPMDVPPVVGKDVKTGKEVIREPKDEAPFVALAFKVVADPFVGRLVYLRIYSGGVKAGARIFNSSRGEMERVGRLLLMHANRREEVDSADTGGIVASLGLKDTLTGDTLCNPSQAVVLESIRFPEPVVSVAIEPRTRADQDKMGAALQKLAEEDPTFKITYNQDTGQTLISGMGELHLEVLVSRMLTEFGVDAKVGKPQVAYKETITIPVEAEGRFVKQTGGHGQFGVVQMEFEPTERGNGFEFEDKLKGSALPRNFVPAIESGVKEAMEAGTIAGYPVVDIKARLIDGSYHEVDSSELAFKMAGSLALKKAMAKGNPVILEPIMKLEVVTPEQFMGDLIGDITARRGHIESIETFGGTSVIRSIIPLSETFGYTTSLRSLTQGRATHSLEFYQYREVNAELAKQIIKAGT
jgi:elongation factor G